VLRSRFFPTLQKVVEAMSKIRIKMFLVPVALASALACLDGPASAAPFVHVTGSGVTGQSQLDITGLTVRTGETTISPTAYTTIESDASATIGGTDPSTSQKFTGPGFTPTSASTTFDQAGGQTYTMSSISNPSSMSAYSEALTSAPSVTADTSNVQSLFFTAATAGNYDILYGMHGHVQVDGTVSPNPGTAATADYQFGVDITRQVGTGAPVTTHVGLEKGGVAIPIFGTIYTAAQDQDKALGIEYTITNVAAGERIQLQFYETSAVTASIGPSAVPEPSSLLLACVGLVGMGASRLRRRSAPISA
jgi:PEP-CTERM motif